MTERLSDDEVAGLALCPGIERLAQEVQASRKLVADLLALLDRMGAGTCEHDTTPGFRCERNGRTPDARYGADKSCPSCDYHALRQLIEASGCSADT